MTNLSSLVMLPVSSRLMAIVVIGVHPRFNLLTQIARAPLCIPRVATGKILGMFADVSAPVVLGLKLKRVGGAILIVRCKIIPDGASMQNHRLFAGLSATHH